MSTTATPSSHTWKFYRIGGLDQVALENGTDLINLKHLDQKLWVALSCPVKGLELDEKTLALIDTDKDGRIRVPELLAAIDWAALVLNDLGILLKDSDSVPLSAFNTSTPVGLAAQTSAKRILASLGKSDASAITLAEASDTVRLFASTHFNGDGIITADSTGTDDLKLLVAQIISTHGAQPDRSGVSGIDQARLDSFYADATAFAAWSDKGASADVLTLGADTAAAHAAIQTVSAKVDDYFSRTRLAAYDSRALAALNRSETEYLTIAAKDLSITASEVAGFPLARIAADQPLPLLAGVNPAWAAALSTLHAAAVTPAFGATKTVLTETEWTALKAKVAAFAAWSAAKTGAAVEPLGLDRVKAILAANKQAELAALIAKDKSLEPEFTAIASVEKILRYTRDFRALLHNFVNFFDFYSPDYLATFQAGTLYLDNRSTEFCIEVAGPAPLAAMSKAYIAYCDLTRAGLPSRKIAACFTQGDSDFLFVGRNGIFYDRQGRDWDAAITSIVDNPISVRQAFFSPYKKFVRMIEEQAAKRAAAADAESNARLAAAAEKTANADKSPPAPPKKFDVGVIAALGVAAGALGTVLGGLIGGFLGLGMWMPLGLLGIILVISGPSMAIAWLKLRQRNLGPILEANGWAINGRVKINIPFGTKLTERAVLPKDSKLDLTDPYEDKKAAAKRRRVSILIVLACIIGGLFWHYESTGYCLWDSAEIKQKVRDERAAAAALEQAKAAQIKKDAEAKAAAAAK
ncbi:MAG: hypothetical protein RIQ79_1371 [Verrucomicrobiota bacterium]